MINNSSPAQEAAPVAAEAAPKKHKALLITSIVVFILMLISFTRVPYVGEFLDAIFFSF